MQQNTFIGKPVKLNLDADAIALTPEYSPFILNQRTNVRGAGKNRAWYGNEQRDQIELPAGDNIVVGTYFSPYTKEGYAWHWNSSGNHFISRENAQGTTVVYQGRLGLRADPASCINGAFRAEIQFVKKEDGARGIFGKYLLWCFGSEIYYLDVELSILTDSFNLQSFQQCVFDPLDYIRLEARQPQRCIVASLVDQEDDRSNIADTAFQFRYKYTYYDGRQTEWSPISSLYWVDYQACGDVESGSCWKLTVPSGNAFVEKIHIAFRTDNSNNWQEYDIVQKYGPYVGAELWYQRDIALPNYDPDACSFEYVFCNNKKCDAISPRSTARLFNPIPWQAQAIDSLNDTLAVFNGRLGNKPLAKTEKDKIDFEVSPVDRTCYQETAIVKIAAVILSESNGSQFVYRLNGKDGFDDDDKSDTAFFGGLQFGNSGIETGYDQEFKGDVRNFIAYVEGSEYWAEMKQYKVTATGTEEWGPVAGMGRASARNQLRRTLKKGEYFIQQAEIRVPKGSRGFIRLASHHAEGNEQDTSTQVIGRLRTMSGFDSEGFNRSLWVAGREIYFDTCQSDYLDLTDTPFAIYDAAVDYIGLTGTGAAATLVYGYIKDQEGSPVQNLTLRGESTLLTPIDRPKIHYISETDHNGFYFASTKQRFSFKVYGETSCTSFDRIGEIPRSVSERGNAVRYDVEVEFNDEYAENWIYRPYIDVTNCNGTPMAGVVIAVTGHKAVVTDANGRATFAIRNVPSRSLRLTFAVVQRRECQLRDCNQECNPCMPRWDIMAPACFEGNPTAAIGTASFAQIGISEYGLKSGGRYEMAISLIGNGRQSFAQVNGWFVDIPSVQERQNFNLSGVRMVVSGPVVFEPWVTHVAVMRSKNLLYRDYLQWVVDEVEFIDDNGNSANRFTGSAIRLTIQSLNDYNENSFFKTTTKYQYSDGDRVEFIANGDGAIYTEQINVRIRSPFAKDKEDKPENFFNQIVVPADSRLSSIQPGALIEIQQPKDCETNSIFQEICSPIPVALFRGTIELPTFDTYKINRQIPENTMAFSFEHHSISDFWGDHIDDAGRLNVANEYEDIRILDRAMFQSDAWGYNGSYNGINAFDEERIKIFDGQEQGGIVAAKIKDNSSILAICEHDYFISTISDNVARVNKDGTLSANPSDQYIGDPQAKSGEPYGMRYQDAGLVSFDADPAWVDANKDVVKFVYGLKDASTDVIGGWLNEAMWSVVGDTSDDRNKLRGIMGFDPLTRSLLITFQRPGVSALTRWDYYFKERVGLNQTIAFDTVSASFTSLLSPTPEAYCRFDNEESFVMYFRSQPWHQTKAIFNTWFGVAARRAVSVAVNDQPTKIKRLLSYEVQSTKKWYVVSVLNESNLASEVPPRLVESALNKHNAEFLNNENSVGGLHYGQPPYGYFFVVLFVRDDSQDNFYRSFDSVKAGEDDQTNLFLIKHVAIEGSGLK